MADDKAAPTLPEVLTAIPLRIDPAEVRAFRGYKRLPSPTDLDARLDAARAEVAAVMRPRLASRMLEVARVEADVLTLRDGPSFRIPAIALHWGAVERVTAALVTIGVEAGDLAATRLAAGDALGADCLDSAASAAVECLAEWVNDELCGRGVAAGLRVTNRISPGLAGWTLAEQTALVGLVPTAAIGVRLEPDGRLTPAKSISLLIGVGRAARVDHYFVQCRRCWAAACPARRLPARNPVG